MILFTIVHNMNAQIVRISNIENGEPLQMVTIKSEAPRAFTTTNSKGQAEISSFQNADLIEIRLVGFKPLFISYKDIRRNDFKIQLDPALVNIDEVVISASRWRQKTSEIPVKITTITPQKVQLYNPQTAADMLGISGKVFIQKSQQGGGSPMIRGFATNRLLYSVDGVRMNTAIYRGGNIQNVISLDPYSIEHTEVLFGPGSVIYGSDAIGGVMSFHTLSPQFSLSDKTLVTGKAISRYSSANNEKTGHVDVNIGGKKWAGLTSFSSYDYGDLKMGSHGPDEYLRNIYVQRQDSTDIIMSNNDPQIQKPSGYSQINLMQKIHYSPNEKWDFHYGFHYSETSDYDRYDRHIRYKDGRPRYGEWRYGPQIWMMNVLNIKQNSINTLYHNLSMRIAHQYFEESRISRDINSPKREERIEMVDAYSINLDLVKPTGKKNIFYYGIEAVFNDVQSTGINTNIETGKTRPGPSRYPQSNWESYAFYISDQLTISNKLNILSGIRYNRYVADASFDTTFYPFPFTSASINNGALTGNLGMVYRPDETWVMSWNVSTAFRSPNIDDIGKVFDSEPGSVTVPNPDLKAEYAYNADIGLAKVFDETVKIDFTAYYTLLQNAMVRRDYSMNDLDSIMYDGEMSRVQAIQNASVATVYGIQAGLEINLQKGFKFTSDFNYQKGEEELEDGTISPTRHAAPWFGISRLIYSSGKLNMQFYSNYSGEKKFEDLAVEEKGKEYMYATDKNGNPYSPGWYTINYKLMYRIAEELTIMAGIENLTDQRYKPYSSGIVAAGRNFIISAKVIF